MTRRKIRKAWRFKCVFSLNYYCQAIREMLSSVLEGKRELCNLSSHLCVVYDMVKMCLSYEELFFIFLLHEETSIVDTYLMCRFCELKQDVKLYSGSKHDGADDFNKKYEASAHQSLRESSEDTQVQCCFGDHKHQLWFLSKSRFNGAN